MRLAIPLLLLLMALPAHAAVDLLLPANGTATNQSTMTFEYYASTAGLDGCAVRVGQHLFPDPDAQSNAMNEVTVANIAAGTYAWNVTCTAQNRSETSQSRAITIDTAAPSIAILAPANGSTVQRLTLDMTPYDDQTAMLSCDVAWDGRWFETIQVAASTRYVKNYSAQPGNGTLEVTCRDTAGNSAQQARSVTVKPELALSLATDKRSYGLAEPVLLSVDTLPGADLTIDVCPNQQGFVQCTGALIDTAVFPQTITLPYMNRTGTYLVEAIARYDGQVRINRTNYTVENTIDIAIRTGRPRINRTIDASATVSGGIAPYRISWRLSNGTTISDRSEVQLNYLRAGTYNETVTVHDAANNVRTENITVIIPPVHAVTVVAKDNATGGLLSGVTLEFDDQDQVTGSSGTAYFELEEGEHRLLASAPGYRYLAAEYEINASQTIEIRLRREDAGVPQVTILEPAHGAAVATPVRIRYAVVHKEPVTCTLLRGSSDNWFVANGTAQVSDDAAKEFIRSYEPGLGRLRIECTDAQGRTGTSPTAEFTVQAAQDAPAGPAGASPAPTDAEIGLQEELDGLTALLDGMAALGQREKEAIALTGFDRRLREAKRAVQQAIRDIDSLRYRTELDEPARAAERQRIIDGTAAVLAATPRSITVIDDASYAKYVEEEDIDEVMGELAARGVVPAQGRSVRSALLEDQQKFTVSTRLMHLQYVYGNGSSAAMTLVSRSLSYAEGLGAAYTVVELIPEPVASDGEIILLTEAQERDPLRFGQPASVAYLIPRKVDFKRLEETRTVLVRPHAAGNSLTGLAVFSGGDLLGSVWPLLALAALAAAYLMYRFGIIRQARYLIYRLRRNEKVEYLRVLIRDAEDQLAANDYGRAELLYKEVRMTYETLPAPAQNELYEEIIGLVRRLDEYYFNLVMLELDGHVKAGELEEAIRSYEKLTRIFERLDPQRQGQLINTVVVLGRRLGLEVPA